MGEQLPNIGRIGMDVGAYCCFAMKSCFYGGGFPVWCYWRCGCHDHFGCINAGFSGFYLIACYPLTNRRRKTIGLNAFFF
jgi:hypothetical protein